MDDFDKRDVEIQDVKIKKVDGYGQTVTLNPHFLKRNGKDIFFEFPSLISQRGIRISEMEQNRGEYYVMVDLPDEIIEKIINIGVYISGRETLSMDEELKIFLRKMIRVVKHKSIKVSKDVDIRIPFKDSDGKFIKLELESLLEKPLEFIPVIQIIFYNQDHQSYNVSMKIVSFILKDYIDDDRRCFQYQSLLDVERSNGSSEINEKFSKLIIREEPKFENRVAL